MLLLSSDQPVRKAPAWTDPAAASLPYPVAAVPQTAPGEEDYRVQSQEAEKAAASLGVTLVVIEVRAADYERAFASMASGRATALFVMSSTQLNRAPGTDHRAGRQAPAARDLPVARASGGGRPDGLWQRCLGTVAAHG